MFIEFLSYLRGRLGYPNHTIKCSLQRNTIQIDGNSLLSKGLESQGCLLPLEPFYKDFFPKNSQYQRSHILKSLGIRSLRENAWQKMFWQAFKAFHWVGNKTDHAGLLSKQSKCVISEVTEKLLSLNITLTCFFFKSRDSFPNVEVPSFTEMHKPLKGRGWGIKLTCLVTIVMHCTELFIHILLLNLDITFEGKNSSSEFNYLPKVIQLT